MKCHSLGSDELCVSHTHNYLIWLFEYCFHCHNISLRMWFSALVHIKTRAPNWRKIEDDTRLALSNKVGHTVAKSKVASKMFMKFNGRLKLNVMKCIFVVHSSNLVVVCCIFLEMHFVVIIVVIIEYIEKRAERRSQVVWRYQRKSQAEQCWEILHSMVCLFQTWYSQTGPQAKLIAHPCTRGKIVAYHYQWL